LPRLFTLTGRNEANSAALPRQQKRLPEANMNNRQQDEARTFPMKLMSVSTLALIIGIGAAQAQTNNEPRKDGAEKRKDSELLTPVRPLPRKVGETSWPSAKPDSQKAADEKKAQNNQPQQQPSGNAQNNPPPQQPATAQTNAPPAQNKDKSDQQSLASIRLGTDASGKVAINDDQERQLVKALRKQRVEPADVAVKVGSPPPRDVRLAAVPADMVEVLPQFRGYSYFATASEVYIVDPEENRVVALLPVKPTETASRQPATRSTSGSAPAPETTASVPTESRQPESRSTRGSAPAHEATASVPAEPRTRSARSKRRGDDLAGVEAAVEREMIRRGMIPRSSGRSRVVVIEEEPPPRVYRVPRPWFFGGGPAIEIDDD
jgi:hypothetical protein